MEHFYGYIDKMQSLYSSSWKLTSLAYRLLISKCNAFFTSILYFLSISSLGFVMLKSCNPRTTSYAPSNIDLLFTSVSAATASSMMTVEMEVFSQQQLIVMTALMLLGGEIFTSICFTAKPSSDHQIHDLSRSLTLRNDSIKYLGILVLGYVAVIQILGVASLLTYLSLVSSAGSVLRRKGIKPSIFAVFTIVSTFANCGFIPTNENLIVFSGNTGLLLILIPQILLGNTLFPLALRGVIWGLGKRFKRNEAEYLLRNSREVGFPHLLPRRESLLLAATAVGFVFAASVLFSAMEWYAVGLDGLNSYRKVVGVVFQCANARHAGENIVDLSTIAPAVLLFFILMMYLPPYTSFVPIKRGDQVEDPSNSQEKEKRKRHILVDNFAFSQLSYVAIFIILICVTERKSLKEDPINFSVLNIAFEVISAYGNVGLTTGYSCDRQLRADPKCVSKWYGLAGKWSDEAKLILIVVMFYGRLKKFNIKGGRAWKLL
ncbi:cation transporter HKT1;5-like [Salvia miltiorrhiza]|uniref:cation transporter HKT1;5-like n=1 Tax=Salvia miltiorrhiza TaxID=226208 RepID=UPI0025AB8584|nr:cation transporter HKT1;5-like [Salvia miltiorrhiza]